ncbi:MAG: hypothetical protein GY839_09505 [candidate division Zixibacteria bacterium]|nr:hypothetical protein [candidate division Zixibacteria bacterium]
MALYDKIKNIDRRVIFLFISLSVIIPLLLNITFSEKAGPIVKNIFNKIESLPAGSRVLLSMDYGPSTVPEIQPMVNVLVRHCNERNIKIFYMCLWATGQNLTTTTVDSIQTKEFPEKQYGIDYVNLGYKAGNEGLINVLITDMKKMYTTDVNGTYIDDIPIMREVSNLTSFDLIVGLGGGTPGIKEWILFAGDPGNIDIAGGCTAVQAPLLYPYWPNQLLGMMGGIKGAAEYESELISRYPKYKDKSQPGIKMMGPQAIAHIVIMIFIIIGNITFFVERSRANRKGEIG